VGRTLLGLLAPERFRLGVALIVTLAAALAELLPPALISQSIAPVLAGPGSGEALVRIAGLIAAALLGKYLLYSLAYYFSHVAAFRLLAEIRQRLVRQLAIAPIGWLHRHGSGEIKKIVLQDVERLEQFIAHHTVECLAAAVSPLFVLGVLLWIDGRLALAALLTVPLAAACQALLMRGLGARLDEYNRAIGALNGATVEYVRNAPVMKAFCQNARSFERMRALLARYHALVSAVTRQTVPGWSVFLVLLGANIVFLLPVGLWLFRQGEISLAGLMLALMLGTGMLKPLFRVAHFGSEIREIAAGLRRIAPILAVRPPPVATPSGPSPGSGPVVFEGVSFAYDGRTVLDGVSFTLPAGGFTALVGPSGGGKSTIAHLLGGLMAPAAGTIRIGAVPLAALNESDRARLITVASQESFLFRGTLLENLCLGRPTATEAQVRRAVRVAQAEELVAALPEGYQTRVGERGTRLSGGECQRIAVARALLCDTPVLVLDEATAFADGRTERRFYEALRTDYPDKTLLVIAHRLTTIGHADQVLVLAQGRLVDHGPHDDLLARSPFYRALWQRQFDSESWSLRPEGSADAAFS
jgi:sulfate-transporting ATPase/ATP-binding cassette subfamily B protein